MFLRSGVRETPILPSFGHRRAFLPVIGLRMLVTSKRCFTLSSQVPLHTEQPGQALSCSVAEGYVAQLRFCDHTAKDTIRVGHLLCCFQKFQVHQNYGETVLTKAINVFRRELTQYVKYFSPPSYFPPPTQVRSY